MKVAIIGGGASGIMCAISLLRQSNNISVAVYEKNPRILKKILVTGNGRCNLTNVHANQNCYRGDREFTKTALDKFSPESNIAFFESIGLAVRTENEGRVYPMSSQAASVVTALLEEAERLGVKLNTSAEITTIEKRDGAFVLNGNLVADCVVVASGGSAQKQQGTDGGSFKLLSQLGVKIINPVPALTALNIVKFTRSLKGIRNICNVSLETGGKSIYSEKGEVQFTDYGVSGIPIMQLSSLVSTAQNDNFSVVLDCLPDMKKEKIIEIICASKQRNPLQTAESVMCGLLPKSLGNHLTLLCDIKKDKPVGEIGEKKIGELAEIIKHWVLRVESVRDFDFAQVTAGGADCGEFNPTTLECKKVKNLYCTGEALNVDGLCGGFNLQWAWSTGRLCADGILKENQDCLE